MAQHFSQSKAFRDLSVYKISNLSEVEAYEMFKKFRWPDESKIPCPNPECDYVGVHYLRSKRSQFRCKSCYRDFSVTSGTPFSCRKLSFKKILFLIHSFVSSPKGCAANKIHADADVTIRTAYLNIMKLREVLYLTQDKSPLEGIVQIDGGHFCGKPRRGRKRQKSDSYVINNKLRNRKDSIVPDTKSHPEQWNLKKLKNRRIVLVMRELYTDGTKGARRTITSVILAEDSKSVLPLVMKYVKKGSIIQTDSGHAFSRLSAFYDHQAVNHSVEYQTDDGINNNQAESFMARLRRGEYGVHHGMRPQYFALYVSEMAWREDVKMLTLSERLSDLMLKVMTCGKSAFANYSHGRRLGFEYLN